VSARPAPLPRLTNLREIGGPGFQAGRRRTVYRANTERVSSADYPSDLVAVLDLRRDDEVERVPHPLLADLAYRRVPLFDPASELEAAAEAVRLEEQYIDWLERHRATIPAVFHTLAATDGDALVCCSAGKDRTGVVSALLARLWGADLDRIGADYALTRERLAERFAEDLAASTNPDWTRIQQACLPEVMITVVQHVEQYYGGVPDYLCSIGLSQAEIAAL
jgi:protein-tyrosine phosphatase